MLRKNKCFLEGVNLVESQIIYPDSQPEDVRHRRRMPEQPHPEYLLRKTYNFEPRELLGSASPKPVMPIHGRRSLIDPDTYTSTTQRNNDANRKMKAKATPSTLRGESRLGDEKTLLSTLRPSEA